MIVPIIIPSKGSKRVVAYTVHEPPEPPADRLDRAEQLVFVKDGFDFAAAIAAPAWLLANRLWLAFAGYVAAMVILIGVLIVAPAEWIALAILVVHVIVGFEADQLRRMKLESTGYTLLGSVIGRNEGECERRFIEKWLPGQPILTRSGTIAAAPATALLAHAEAPIAAIAAGDVRPGPETAAGNSMARRMWRRLAWARTKN